MQYEVPHPASRPAVPDLEPVRVLLAEDDPVSQHVVSVLLDRLGYRVAFVYEKYREEYEVPDALVTIDETPVGVFVDEGVDRINARGAQDTFESLPQLTKSREIFLSLNEPHIVKLDAKKPPAELHESVLFHLLHGPLKESAQALHLDEPPEDPSLRAR